MVVRLLFVFLVTLLTTSTYGQTKVLTGRTIDEHFQPLSNAAIHTIDSTFTTRADEDGYFRIEVPVNTSKLVAWYVGLETDTFNIESKCYINMLLLDDIKIEFQTVEEAKKFDKKRKKHKKPLYKEAIKKGILKEEKFCS
ncbi:carboxypeptidase-like regulatory domain-containing protein [Pontibacter sp. 172403-2]|uniref:carboxypeptidase-like regulatory domain-containing protein n=1 Tax=Pontibacter rufus TaxID=2791028 RepID=UPI0018AF68DB|nr:carboxypeptidase-like regulatory domain-containing protein [Pontibacter sp. 172403-2]MBF9253491.1 carboxypeptidase-like regulatory domain-containing protein [Pontibacter sp. 172403-2]